MQRCRTDSPLQCGNEFATSCATVCRITPCAKFANQPENDARSALVFVTLEEMKALRRSALLVAAVFALAACGDVSVTAPSTTIEAESGTDEEAVDAVTTTVPAPTTTVESTTTTVPVTTTTVLDISCIKTTACQYANLVGVDFSRLRLSFVDFSVSNLSGANFVGANLANSVFIRADLRAVNFEGASLKNADFTAALLSAASFKNADLEGAVFCDTDLSEVLELTKEQLDKVKKFRPRGRVYCP